MDSVENYRTIIRRVLLEYASIPLHRGDLHYLPVFDREHDRYLLIIMGWDGPKHVHHIVFQLDLIEGKIWLQCDNTDAGIAYDLDRAGVPKKDIVLGFQPPEVRPLTEYAVA
jgi:hypothetical protein